MKIQSHKDNFSDLTTEDLIKKKNATSLTTGLLAGVLVALFIVTTLQTINKGVTALVGVPFALLPSLIQSYSQVKSINKELKSRNIN